MEVIWLRKGGAKPTWLAKTNLETQSWQTQTLNAVMLLTDPKRLSSWEAEAYKGMHMHEISRC